jgi:hypothetical protein
VITDRELDAQLAGAAGIRDADLPALPEDFLGHLTTPTAVDRVTTADSEPASLVAARQLVSDARDARTATGPRRRRPGRKALLRAGVAVVAIAAAWTAAVLVTPPDRAASPDGTAAPITLVAAEEITFPLSLDPAPEGLTPTFSRFGGVAPFEDYPLVFTADYRSADGYGDGFTLWLHSEDPRGLDDYFQPEDSSDYDITEAGTVSIDGSEAEFASGDYDTNTFANLLWERPDGRWVQILGNGAYGETAAVVAVAESIVDRPQPVGLQFGLAPAGWSLNGYEESRSIDLSNDEDPQQRLILSLIGREGGATLDTVLEGEPMAAPVTPVTVQGAEGRLALLDGFEDPDYWRLVGQLPNGPMFLLVAPQALTQEQVLQIAEQVTYTP